MYKILTIVFLLLIIYKLNHKEHFQVSFTCSFASLPKAQEILCHSNYFSYFNDVDVRLRSRISRWNEMTDIYNNSIEKFTPKEKENMQKRLSVLIPKLQKKIPQLPWNEWNFIKANSIEGEMPHTRDRWIVLPSYEISDRTLIHEQIHVFQKKFPAFFEDLYKNYWGFEKPTVIHHMHLINNNRTNPDGLDLRWIFRYSTGNYVLPISIYKPNAKTIRDVNHVLYPVKKLHGQYYLKNTPLPILDSNYYYFFKTTNNYHPNEIAATYFEYYFNGNFSSQGFNKFKIWLKNKFIDIQ